MPCSTEIVTSPRAVRQHLPDEVSEGAALVTYLQGQGILDQVGDRLRVERQGGYAGLDAFAFFLYLFASGRFSGIKDLYQSCAPFSAMMAALAGRKSLPSTSAMSRILSRVDVGVVRRLTHWLLLEGSAAREVLEHPSVAFVDTEGNPWQIFDYDGTRKAFRQRALPEGEDLPRPVRRSERLAAPGFQGRKRGEVVMHRSALQHRGSSLWLDTRLAPGGGERRAELSSAIEAVTSCCTWLEHPRSRTLICADGEFGDVPSLTAAREAGLCMITRLNRPKLLDQADVREAMAGATWTFVPDGRSGPRRSAMELGVVTVRPGQETVRDDGSAYDPIDVRVVITRYRREGEAEHGRVIDGWQYELFAALDVDAVAWPAAEVAHLYFGRTSLENRFAQEDRVLGLDHILSYELGGQELASVVGLFVWNLRVVRGFLMDPPPMEASPPVPRTIETDPRPVPPATPLLAPPTVEASPTADPVPRLTTSDAEEQLRHALGAPSWDHLLRHFPNWRFDQASGTLVCPHEQALSPTSLSPARSSSSSRLQFVAPPGVCATCPVREGCFHSARPDARKLACVSLAPHDAARIAPFLRQVQHNRKRKRSEVALAQDPPSGKARPSVPGQPLPLAPAVPEGPGSLWAPQQATLVPSRARHAISRACASLIVRVDVHGSSEDRLHPYLVPNEARRQARRATWQEALARYALPSHVHVRIEFEGGEHLRTTFGWPLSEARAA